MSAPAADRAPRRLFALIGVALLAVGAVAVGCSEPPPTSLLAPSPTATAIPEPAVPAETAVPETDAQPAPAAPPTADAGPGRDRVETPALRGRLAPGRRNEHQPGAALSPRGGDRTAARRPMGGPDRRLLHRVEGRGPVPNVLPVPQRRERDDLLRRERRWRTLGKAVARPVPVRGLHGQQHRLARARVPQLRGVSSTRTPTAGPKRSTRRSAASRPSRSYPPTASTGRSCRRTPC